MYQSHVERQWKASDYYMRPERDQNKEFQPIIAAGCREYTELYPEFSPLVMSPGLLNVYTLDNKGKHVLRTYWGLGSVLALHTN